MKHTYITPTINVFKMHATPLLQVISNGLDTVNRVNAQSIDARELSTDFDDLDEDYD